MRLEEPRVFCPPPDERLLVRAGQHRGDGMPGALAHNEGGEHSLGRERVEGDGCITGRYPAAARGMVKWATPASSIGGRLCRPQPLPSSRSRM